MPPRRRRRQPISPPGIDHITDIPMELLQSVASNLPASSVLSLSSTCHQLRRACDKWVVFRDILIKGSNSGSSNRAWRKDWDLTKLYSCINTPNNYHWKRWAVADEKALEFMKTPLERLEDTSIECVLKWAPYLAVMHHPLILSEHAKSLFANLFYQDEWKNMQKPERHLFWFCITASALSIYPKNPNFYRQCPLFRIDLYTTDNPHIATDSYHAYRIIVKFYTQLFPTIAEGKVGVEIYEKYGRLGGPRPSTASSMVPLPPLTGDIPFASYFNLSGISPFPRRTDQHPINLRRMTTREFLSDGEWTVGIVYDQYENIDRHMSHFTELPKRGIRLVVQQNTGNPNIFDIKSEGEGLENLASFTSKDKCGGLRGR